MNKDNARDYLPLVKALADGKTIEYFDGELWDDIYEPNFEDPSANYRIKLTPQYRPWNLDEVPVSAVVKSKDKRTVQCISGIHLQHPHSVWLTIDNLVGLQLLFDNYTMLDGTPCGVPEDRLYI